MFSLSNSVQTSDEYCGETFDEDQENRDILEKIKKLEKIARTGSNSGRELLSDVSVSDSFIYDLNRQ